jgi:hypothetical protein
LLTSKECSASSLGTPGISDGGLCEYVNVVPEGTGEREFLFLPDVVTDDHRLGWVGKAKVDLLCCWRSIQGGLGALLLREGEVGRSDLLGLGDHDS